ncbi:MAG: 50S ribosomal protein L18e [Candidatus Micrarchaeota archaeon]
MERGAEEEYVLETALFLEKSSKKNKAAIWNVLADKLRKPRRQRVEINLEKINANSADNGTVVVPGKVLGTGVLEHKVTIGALKYSASVAEKVKRAGGELVDLKKLVEKNPKGTDVKILQ